MTKKQKRFADEYIISGCVYLIENKVNKKKYVGITTRGVSERFEEHCKAESYLGNAIRKHGRENFSIKVIERVQGKENLFKKEIEWIQKLKTFGEGYNLTRGGDGVNNIRMLNETLNERQVLFCRIVENKNKKPLQVDKKEEILRFTILNTVYLFLKAETVTDRKSVYKMMKRLDKQVLQNIFDLNIISKEQIQELN